MVLLLMSRTKMGTFIETHGLSLNILQHKSMEKSIPHHLFEPVTSHRAILFRLKKELQYILTPRSKHLPVFQKGEQIRVYRKAREARTPVSREGSSVDGERYTTYGQSTNVINAKLFITASNSTASFMLRFAIASE